MIEMRQLPRLLRAAVLLLAAVPLLAGVYEDPDTGLRLTYEIENNEATVTGAVLPRMVWW